MDIDRGKQKGQGQMDCGGLWWTVVDGVVELEPTTNNQPQSFARLRSEWCHHPSFAFPFFTLSTAGHYGTLEMEGILRPELGVRVLRSGREGVVPQDWIDTDQEG